MDVRNKCQRRKGGGQGRDRGETVDIKILRKILPRRPPLFPCAPYQEDLNGFGAENGGA